MQVLFGILLLVYAPRLDPYPGYTPIGAESVDDAAYEELHGGEQVCPERHFSVFCWLLSINLHDQNACHLENLKWPYMLTVIEIISAGMKKI